MRLVTLPCLLLSVLVGVAANAATSPHTHGEALRSFFAAAYEQQLRDEPEEATAAGRHEYDDRWTDWSVAGRAERRAHREAELRELARLPLEGVSDQDRLSARLFRYVTEQDLAAEDLETHLLRVGQLYGLHTQIYQTIDLMPARTLADYERLLARLHRIPAYVDQHLGVLEEARSRGLTQPVVVVDLVVDQLTKQLQQTSDNSALLAAFRQFPTNIPAGEQARLRAAASESYERDFKPAWEKLKAFIDGPYRARARAQVGIGSLPDGKAAYAVLVRRLTTTSLSPEEIHRIGEQEVTRIEVEMLAAARETGFQGSLADFSKQLADTPAQHFRDRDEMLAYCRNLAKIIEPQLPGQFRRIPLLLYGVRAIPPDRERATATNAQAAAPDGSTPGWFNLNTYEPQKQFRFDKDALVLHEAVPGHIFQRGIQRSLSDLPEFRKYYGNSAYVEGWALYAESLGHELGVYQDAYSRFGQLSSERFRAVRLVVDTGLHAYGWSRDQAIEYFHQHAPEASLAEVDRYIYWPGQALAYKLGQLEILRLRKEAERRLGARFDVREFHDAVLKDGVLPLELLDEQVEKYISGVK